MPRQNSAPIAEDHGWLITPRALTSVATVVGLVYTLYAPVRYVVHVGETVDALSARVGSLETELEHQRGTIAAAELVIERQGRLGEPNAATESTARVAASDSPVGRPAIRSR